MSRIILAMVLCGCAASSAWPVEQVRSIPPPFRGYWEANRAMCGTGQGDGILIVSADQIRFYESIGPVRAVVADSPREITVVAQLRGEGETWLAHQSFRLSQDGNTMYDPSDGEAIWYRCPGQAPR